MSASPGDLRARLTTVAWLLPLTIAAILFLPPLGLAALLCLAFLRADWELGVLLGSRGPRLVALVAWLAVLAACWAFVQTESGLPWLAGTSVALWLFAVVAILRYPFPIPRTAVFLASFPLLVPAAVCLAWMVMHVEQGRHHLLCVIAVIAAADSGAYFTGRRFGRRKLSPRVSGAKTWEGLFGGLAAATLAGLLGSLLLDRPGPTLIAIAAVTALASVVGDLTASVFKRSQGLSDYPTLFRGHGGMLDRIDGWTCAAPVYVLGLWWSLRDVAA